MVAPQEPQWLVSGEGFVNIRVVAKPGSTRQRILRTDPRGLVIELCAHPSQGRANAELIAFLADLLGTARSSVTIVRGQTARVKTVRIENPQPLRVAALIRACQ
jgi:uncharacterized protein (TIGR00251 family)